MHYSAVQQYLDSFINYEKDPDFSYANIKIERMHKLLDNIGNPQNTFKSIHIAGTKGKGSTCAFIFSILKEYGLKVGLYTSPHLIDFRERIKIGQISDSDATEERLISEHEVGELIAEIKPEIEKIKELTFFEVYTAIAFKFFAKEKVDFAVLETGLGGRLDATNVINPAVCGITNISYDHAQILGETLEKIATEKAGIIKDDSLVISAPQPPEVWRVINKVCQQRKAKLYEVGRDFFYELVGQDLRGSVFDFHSAFGDAADLHISLLGQHQLINVTLALGVIQLLRFYEIVVSFLAIKKGLEKTRWPGRMQIVHQHPFLVLDGAQNAESARALITAVNALFTYKRFVLILGVSKDKDIEGLCHHLCRQPNLIILTQAQIPRALDTESLEKTVRRFNRHTKKTSRVEQALKLALEDASQRDLIVVAGSLYLIGEVLKNLRSLEFPSFRKGKSE